jgi:hypothetical protein
LLFFALVFELDFLAADFLVPEAFFSLFFLEADLALGVEAGTAAGVGV